MDHHDLSWVFGLWYDALFEKNASFQESENKIRGRNEFFPSFRWSSFSYDLHWFREDGLVSLGH